MQNNVEKMTKEHSQLNQKISKYFWFVNKRPFTSIGFNISGVHCISVQSRCISAMEDTWQEML